MTNKERLLPIVGFMILLATWALITSTWIISNPAITHFSPQSTAPALWDVVHRARTWEHAVATLQRILVGLSIAALIGLPFGVLLGSSKRFRQAMMTPLQFVRMISPLAWMPIAAMILGIGNPPIYFLVCIATTFPLMLNTAAGVQTIDPRWLEMSTSLGASSLETLRHVTIPAIRGYIITGLRVALGISWLVIVPAEMLGVRSGLGYAILDARDRMAYPEIMAIILVIGFFGWLMDTSLRMAESRWGTSGDQETSQVAHKKPRQEARLGSGNAAPPVQAS